MRKENCAATYERHGHGARVVLGGKRREKSEKPDRPIALLVLAAVFTM